MKRGIGGATLGALLVSIAGCTTSSESAKRDDLTAHVGKYDPPPTGLKRVKVGVPQFNVDTSKVPADLFKKEEVAKDAADILTTLADNSDRFEVIERAQLNQLLKEQGLEGVVDPEELAQPGRVKGVDYLMIGKVTNMRVKAEKSKTDFSLGNILPGAGLFDINNEKETVTVECGVDIRLVNPTAGTVLSSAFGEYKRTDSIGATGMHILGFGGKASADLQIDEDSRGKLLRLALDDAVRKMLPKTDKRLMEKQASEPPKETPKDTPPAVKKCAGCGKEDVPADAAKCPGCGADMPK